MRLLTGALKIDVATSSPSTCTIRGNPTWMESNLGCGCFSASITYAMSLAAFAIQNQITVENFVPLPNQYSRLSFARERQSPLADPSAPSRRQPGDWRSQKPDCQSRTSFCSACEFSMELSSFCLA